VSVGSCSSPLVCSSGSCVCGNHECNPAGIKRCNGSIGGWVQTCTLVSGCRKWVNTTYCVPSQRCNPSTLSCTY
jgi:hypothetical protein